MSQFKCPACGNQTETLTDINALRGVVGGATSRAIMNLLCDANGSAVTMDQMIDAAYADDIDGGPDNARNTIAATLCGLRKRVHPMGWQIPKAETIGLRGNYRLVPLEAS